MREQRPAPAFHPPRRSALRFWVITAAAIAVVAVTLALGRWQLSRAAQKEALQASIETQQAYPALEMADFLAVEQPLTELHRKVRLRGLWLPTQTLYLDNRQMHGQPGFYVLTPFALEGTTQTLMVQRGWVPRNFTDRTQLPPVDTPAGLVDIEARIEPPPARLLQLGADPPAQPASAAAPLPEKPADVANARIRQNLDLETFRNETGLPLRTDFSLQQVGPASEGLLREWPVPALGIEKHYGYAFQWFGLAALVVILYVWFQLIAPRRRRTG
ncbi:SURF1 family protein [Pseudacidovorax intermedius]|uniref:SURF1-like protein n=1 Tax=Pseudacidovorax intermedius TaxID=433924 RepID=A0A147GN14_9BURK|nr:SURF1 family protein [Pseudacidovorax intermedius]KTT15295.1 transmembrane cytochrome oxidase [Pseudacidovorax intermedius]